MASANPRAHVAEIAPNRPIVHPDQDTQTAIVAAADVDFVQGIRAALGLAVLLLAIALAAGYRGFPRGGAAVTDAEREAAKLRVTET